MRTAVKIVAIVSVVAVLAACGAPGLVSLGEAKVTESVERTLTLGANGTVAIRNVNGSIRIQAAEGGDVRLHAVKSGRDPARVRETAVEVDESPGRIDIETKIPKRGWFGNGGVSVAYNLEVPRGTAVVAASVNGSIDIRDLRGAAAAKTVNGSVRIANAGGSVDVQTVNGSVRVAYAEAGPGADTENSFKTVNGSVRVVLPGEVGGAFQANTVNGSISTELPLEVRKSKSGRHQSINDSLGEGGAAYAFRTVNGSIRILKD